MVKEEGPLKSYLQYGYIPLEDRYGMLSTSGNRYPEHWNMPWMIMLFRRVAKALGKDRRLSISLQEKIRELEKCIR